MTGRSGAWEPLDRIEQLNETGIHVLRVDLEATRGRLEALTAMLPADERGRAGGLARDDDARRFVAGRWVLRRALAAAVGTDPRGLVLRADDLGKPALSGRTGPAFNVAHSGDRVLVALAPAGRLGVDVERHRSDLDLDDIATLVFSEAERRELELAAANRRLEVFYELWTRKEAVIKAAGGGFAIPTTRLTVTTGRFPRLIADDADGVRGRPWRLHDIDVGAAYHAAVAHDDATRGQELRLWDARALLGPA